MCIVARTRREMGELKEREEGICDLVCVASVVYCTTIHLLDIYIYIFINIFFSLSLWLVNK